MMFHSFSVDFWHVFCILHTFNSLTLKRNQFLLSDFDLPPGNIRNQYFTSVRHYIKGVDKVQFLYWPILSNTIANNRLISV